MAGRQELPLPHEQHDEEQVVAAPGHVDDVPRREIGPAHQGKARTPTTGGLLILPVGFISAIIGMAAAVLHPGIVPAEALPRVVLDLSPLAAGIILAGLWAADVSTASALLMGSATLVSSDIVKRFFKGIVKGRVIRHELDNLLTRNGVPHALLDRDSEQATRLLLDAGELEQVVDDRFQPGGRVADREPVLFAIDQHQTGVIDLNGDIFR